jgi:hypothetical protein
MRIYLASSWRNDRQQAAVRSLRAAGHEVYDFRHPPRGDHLGFSWSDVDPKWRSWTAFQYSEALGHPVAQAGFDSDFEAMQWADAFVLLLPCGRSAHLEAGWAVGAGKLLIVLLDEAEFNPTGHGAAELMYKMTGAVYVDWSQVIERLKIEEEIMSNPLGAF